MKHAGLVSRQQVVGYDLQLHRRIIVCEAERCLEVNTWIDGEGRQSDDSDGSRRRRNRQRRDNVRDPCRHESLAVLVHVVPQPRVSQRQESESHQQRHSKRSRTQRSASTSCKPGLLTGFVTRAAKGSEMLGFSRIGRRRRSRTTLRSTICEKHDRSLPIAARSRHPARRPG